MPEDRFGDLGAASDERVPRRSAAQRFEREDRLRPAPDAPPRRPEVPRKANKYAWAVGIVMFMGIAVLLFTTTLPNTGSSGLRGPARGEVVPDFAAPLAKSSRDGDANVRQVGGGGSDSAGSLPACEIRGQGIYNVCDARKRPLVLTFLATEGADCEPQVDRVERMRAEFPQVEFAAVVSGAGREDIEQIVDRRGWGLPVAIDRDGALVNLYGVAVCPSTVFARAGGRVVDTKLGNLTEDELRAQVRRILR